MVHESIPQDGTHQREHARAVSLLASLEERLSWPPLATGAGGACRSFARKCGITYWPIRGLKKFLNTAHMFSILLCEWSSARTSDVSYRARAICTGDRTHGSQSNS